MPIITDPTIADQTNTEYASFQRPETTCHESATSANSCMVHTSAMDSTGTNDQGRQQMIESNTGIQPRSSIS